MTHQPEGDDGRLLNYDRVEALLGGHDLAAVIATSPENILYLTGYETFQYPWNRFPRAAIFARGRSRVGFSGPSYEPGFMVVQDVDFDRVAVQCYGAATPVPGPDAGLERDEERVAELRARAQPSVVAAVLASIADIGVDGGRIAVDRTGAPAVLDGLMEVESPFDFVGGGEGILQLSRMVKTPAEIRRLRRAAAVNEAGIQVGLALVRERDALSIGRSIRAVVGEQGGCLQHIQFSIGRRSGITWPPVKGNRARLGDRVKYDIGIVLDGYISDLGGTAHVGEPSAGELTTYNAITAGVMAGVRAARPGVRTSALYEEIIGAVHDAGLTSYAPPATGHGIGIEPRDFPVIGRPTAAPAPFCEDPFDPVLEENMVLNIEVPTGRIGSGSFQHEVTIVVGEDGGELLSRLREYTIL